MPLTVPTILTLIRIALVPVLVLLFYLPFTWSNVACVTVFILAAVTDIADGAIARSTGQTSRFGAFLDPVADKIMVSTALVLLVQRQETYQAVFAIAAAISATLLCAPPAAADTRVDFNRDVRPILTRHCYPCHGPDDGARSSELRLDTADGALADRLVHAARSHRDDPRRRSRRAHAAVDRSHPQAVVAGRRQAADRLAHRAPGGGRYRPTGHQSCAPGRPDRVDRWPLWRMGSTRLKRSGIT